MNSTLLSAQSKLREGWEMDNLPVHPNNHLWNIVKEACGLTYPEVASLQNEISRQNSKDDKSDGHDFSTDNSDISSLRNINAFPPIEPETTLIDLSHFGDAFNFLVKLTQWTMYVRDEYKIALNEWRCSNRGFILTGSPGIGKSTFGKLLLCQLISEGERVVYWHGNEESPILFEGTVAKRVNKSTMGHLNETIVIYDDRKGFQRELGECLIKKMLIIHSPSGDINNSCKTLNLGEKIWYMNTASLDECEKIRVACNWEIGEDQLLENFRISGGLLRYLNNNNTNALEWRVKEGCQKVAFLNFANIINYNNLPENSDKLSHRVIHLRRFNDCGGKSLEFGSDFIEEEILKIACEKSNSDILILANKVDINGSLRGDLFENRMHYFFSNGVNFEFMRKPLLSKKTKSISLSSYSQNILFSLSLQVIDNELTLVLLQMTVAGSHPVKRQGLINIMNIVKENYRNFKTILVFLTPPVVFEKWNDFQKVNNGDGTESQSFDSQQETWCLLKSDSNILWNT